MGWLVMTDLFHQYRRPGPRRTLGYLALPGRAALLGEDICCCLFFILHGYFIKTCFLFYLSNWLRLLLIVCGDVESNPGPCSDKWVLVICYNIRGLHANLDELAVAGSGYDVLVCAES